MNVALAPLRAQLKRAFGAPKRGHGGRRLRRRGLSRNSAHPPLPCTAMTPRRAERLLA
jgi:hypothetical protein